MMRGAEVAHMKGENEMMTMIRRGSAILGLSVASVLLLAGCGSDDPQDPTASPSASAEGEESLVPLSDEEALASLYMPAGFEAREQDDVGSCLSSALTKAGVSEDSRMKLIDEAESSDLGSVIQQLPQADKDLMLSSELRLETDKCLEELTTGAAPSASASAPADEASRDSKPAKPNTKPVVKLDEEEEIVQAYELEKGVVSMFSSFTDDPREKKIFAAGGECLAGVIFNSGLSQEGMHFIGGGAPLGTGSVADHLSVADQKIWNSQEFKDEMMTCTLSAESDVEDASASASPSPQD